MTETTRRPTKVVVVMPAYDAARTLYQTWKDIPTTSVQECILVDDASTDNTVELARGLGIHVIEHATNRGYGGNQKTCYTEALARGAEIVILLHPDYQYDPRFSLVSGVSLPRAARGRNRPGAISPRRISP